MSGRPIGSLGHDEIAQTALRDVGFFCIQDAKTGSQMSAMEQNTSQFSSTSKAGWDFCQDNVLNDAVCNISENPGRPNLTTTAYPHDPSVLSSTMPSRLLSANRRGLGPCLSAQKRRSEPGYTACSSLGQGLASSILSRLASHPT